MNQKPLKAKYIIIIAVVLLLIDQVSKILVKTNMTISQEIPVLGEWFNIYFIENSGAAYGMTIFSKLFLSLFRIGAVVALIWYLVRIYRRKAPLGVILAITACTVGALGNIIDSTFYGMIFSESTTTQVASFVPWGEGYSSLLHGDVVDMLYFPIIEIDQMPQWIPFFGGKPYIFFSPIFNVADSYLTVAVIYMIIFQRKFFK
ncbi:MAG: lipoprotein signal peptidase [Rikenellaceae bacterium]